MVNKKRLAIISFIIIAVAIGVYFTGSAKIKNDAKLIEVKQTPFDAKSLVWQEVPREGERFGARDAGGAVTFQGKIFYYSIPSGGPLFKLYERILYEGQKREYIDEVMRLTDAKKVYFVVNNYWSNFQKIVDEAKKTADGWEEIDGGKVMIFTYTR